MVKNKKPIVVIARPNRGEFENPRIGLSDVACIIINRVGISCSCLKRI